FKEEARLVKIAYLGGAAPGLAHGKGAINGCRRRKRVRELFKLRQGESMVAIAIVDFLTLSTNTIIFGVLGLRTLKHFKGRIFIAGILVEHHGLRARKFNR